MGALQRIMSGLPKLSVITVVLNEPDRLRETIESVIRQDYENIEYIIKDGGSCDDTLGIIKEFADRFGFIRYVTAMDSGIYDAMNTALLMASGDVIHFLNAGDRFASADVVSRAMSVMRRENADIVFGDIMYENEDGTLDVRRYPQSCASKLYYLTGDCINHQVIFADRSLFRDNWFDASLKICADREWMLRVGAYTPKMRMKALGFVIAVYPLDGYSTIDKERYKTEADMCIKKYLLPGYPIYALFGFFRRHGIIADMLHRLYRCILIEKVSK